jgi:hypothetical protein
MGLRPLNPPYEMINFSELHITAQVEILSFSGHEALIDLESCNTSERSNTGRQAEIS